MEEQKRIDNPCVIHRSDVDQFMKYGDYVIIFKDSDQALSFVNDFPMFFDGVDAKIRELANDIDDKEGTVWYDSIAGQMEEEKKYQVRKLEKTIE